MQINRSEPSRWVSHSALLDIPTTSARDAAMRGSKMMAALIPRNGERNGLGGPRELCSPRDVELEIARCAGSRAHRRDRDQPPSSSSIWEMQDRRSSSLSARSQTQSRGVRKCTYVSCITIVGRWPLWVRYTGRAIDVRKKCWREAGDGVRVQGVDMRGTVR